MSNSVSYTDGINFPERKYFDLYNGFEVGNGIFSSVSCGGKICYGHALTETMRYGDSAHVVSSLNPWFERGGDFVHGDGIGTFYSNRTNGGAEEKNSWRSVLVIGFGA